MRLRTDWVLLVFTILAVAAVLRFVDLSPRVESEFFFSSDDPQLRATREIQQQFPSPEQIIIRAAGTDSAAGYAEALRALADTLRGVPGVTAVYSVADQDPASPLWGRLLVPPTGNASNLIVQVADTNAAVLVRGVERAVAQFEGSELSVQVSGVPYIVELIRRSLYRDFVTFSVAALVVFGLAIGIVYRAGAVVVGTLASCLLACAFTLLATTALDVRIGLLTANIVTIVFVLTLSHAVFLTANWRQAGAESPDAAAQAVRTTLPASFWCMTTTMLGFLALLFASARPLRELGIAGALGTLIAMVIAFTVYPAFLRRADVAARREPSRWSWRTHPRRKAWLLIPAAAALLAVPAIRTVDTEPSLLTYFARGSDLRAGLEAVDRDGGSSPLYLAVRDRAGGRVDSDSVYARLWDLQESYERDSAVGVVLSPAPLLAHARRQPLAGFLSLPQLLDILDTPALGRIARSFVAEERDQALYFLRMREGRVAGDRAGITARMRALTATHGFEVVTAGGAFELQAQLGRLIRRSLWMGLTGLLLVFVLIAYVVSRRPTWTLAMVAGLLGVPLLVLGSMGWLGLPVDIITSPAANIALAMGVDSMIHLVTRVRRLEVGGVETARAWIEARQALFQPIVGATAIICGGFGIFALSQFPPTQRFGIAVIIGMLTAATMTLVALPLMVSRRRGGASTPEGPA